MPSTVLLDRVHQHDEARGRRIGTLAPAVPDEAYVGAAAGEFVTGVELVEGQAAKKAWGVGIVHVPIDAFFSAINDEVRKVEFTRLEHISVLEGGTCEPRRVTFQYAAVPVVADRWWVVEQRINLELQSLTEGRVREMAWTFVDDGERLLRPADRAWADRGISVAFSHGGWWLVDLGDGTTLVEFWAFSDIGGRVPKWLAGSMSTGGIPGQIQDIARLAAAGPACDL
jgi:hypothetical protein